MLWTMTCRVIASGITFSIGFAVFQIATPTEDLRLSEPPRQITAITLKRQGCLNEERQCPVFEATFRSDGTCTYVGYANDDFIGRHVGSCSRKDFEYLVEQVEKQGFFELPLVFASTPVDETTGVEVTTTNGSVLVTTYNWTSTPAGLRALQAMIEQQTYEVDWKEVEDAKE
jgi:hypothetical protein